MVTCAMCHNEQGAPNGCGFCHAAPPASEHAPDFMKEHGKEALVNEAGVPALPPRQAGVLRQVPRLPAAVALLRAVALHARPARPRPIPANCEACHDKAYCAQCHQVNHPTAWIQVARRHRRQGSQAPASSVTRRACVTRATNRTEWGDARDGSVARRGRWRSPASCVVGGLGLFAALAAASLASRGHQPHGHRRLGH